VEEKEMEIEEKQKLMNLVMYALFHVRTLDDVHKNRFMYNPYMTFVEEFDQERQLTVINTIEWALQLENIEECCTLTGLPFESEFKKEYLRIVLDHFKSATA
jgi:hypothetical protein